MIFPFHDNNPIRRTPFVTYAIIAVNAALFLQSLQLPEVDRAKLWYGRGFVPARMAELAGGGPVQVNPQQIPPELHKDLLAVKGKRAFLKPLPQGQILLSLLTCMFLHGGWFHLIGNMWFLWVFGNNVEDRLGHVLFLLFFLGGGILASGCHWLFASDSTAPVIGASGAVAAILGAYAITWPWARVRTLVFLVVFVTILDLPALLVLGIWFLVQLMAATDNANLAMGGGVAWWAHVGGFLAGLFLMPVLGPSPSPTDQESIDAQLDTVDLRPFEE